MARYYQIHTLTSYPASNLNRDDSGRPKTVIVGGTTRLRISSQSQKRAWRTSKVFQASLEGALGKRTKRAGEDAFKALVAGGIPEKDAKAWANQIASRFGKTAKDAVKTEQLAHIAPEEQEAVDALVKTLIAEKRAPKEEDLDLLRERPRAADIAMFGRMLADSTQHNVDAAVQVAHAFTVHPVSVEDDYFTAVDDLKPREEDAGAGHVGVHEFGAGVFYGYICIDRDALVKNLQGDEALAADAMAALLEAVATISPSGKQNSYASRAYASYILVEKGDAQPRNLSVAYLDGVAETGVLASAVEKLEQGLKHFDSAYGDLASDRKRLNVDGGEGSLADLKAFMRG